MPRPNHADQQRVKFLTTVCQLFSELGYRRTTTAELAKRCGVRENILYRLWPDKKAMFLAAIDAIFQKKSEKRDAILAGQTDSSHAISVLIDHESRHQGEFGFYRLVFTGLTETDDPDIRTALVVM